MSTGNDSHDPAPDSAWVTIRLASPEMIRFWSSGEVTVAKTVIPPTSRKPVRYHPDGLFSERIFGGQIDWECDCGKLTGKHHEGQKCPRCGVKITLSEVRRQRMGHIELAVPVVHPWFLQSSGRPLAALLDAEPAVLNQVVYYDQFVVLDPGETPLQERELLTDSEYVQAREQYGDAFRADTGASAVQELLKRLDVDDLCQQLRQELAAPDCPEARRALLVEQFRVAESLRLSGNKPEWLVLRSIPVIPPDLRPMIPLDRPSRGSRTSDAAGGTDLMSHTDRFRTTDVNELYRRVIQSNTRLKDFVNRQAPVSLLREQKRHLQRAVDALLDRPGGANRPGQRRAPAARRGAPLKSLTGLVSGQPTSKQGRFRASLLGKRVDYSARSVIVNGPGLRLDQCGLPQDIALVLYRPFLIHALRQRGLAPTFRTALNMIDGRDPRVWPVLDEVVRGRPVLLNRAPTLHRMSVQAFQPVLIDDKAIRLHPLACKGFNADFDGDTMAVHLPLSDVARQEARDVVLSTRHLFSPADGKLIFTPSLDVVLGCYYMTVALPPRDPSGGTSPPLAADTARGEGMTFASPAEVIRAYDAGKVGVHARIHVRLPAGQSVVTEAVPADNSGPTAPRASGLGAIVATTAGRALFNDILPRGMGYYDLPMTGKALGNVLLDCHRLLGPGATVRLLDGVKEFGFRAATRSGLSFATADLATGGQPQILEEARRDEDRLHARYQRGHLSAEERDRGLSDLWEGAGRAMAQRVLKEMAHGWRGGRPDLNPISLMVESGARGSVEVLTQMAAMRGYVVFRPGQLSKRPVISNFREGLRPFEFRDCARGGRFTLYNMRASTPQWGYLTRRLVYAAQDVFVTGDDCGTSRGRLLRARTDEFGKVSLALGEQLHNRIAGETVTADDGAVIVRHGEVIGRRQALLLERSSPDGVRVRSPMTCQAPVGVCRTCYGLDLSTGALAEKFFPAGIVAAQSLGERGSQLTLHTKRTTGVAKGDIAGASSRLEHILDPPPASPPPGTDVLDLGDQIVRRMQDLFRGEGAEVDVRHVEVIVAQMLRKVRVVRAGDSGLVPGELIDRAAFEAVNGRLRVSMKVVDPGDSGLAAGQVLGDETLEALAAMQARLQSQGRQPARVVRTAPAVADACVLGISAVAGASNSFLAAAGFERTRDVLGRSSLATEVDELIGPLERIIVGRPQPPTADLTVPRLPRRAGRPSAASPAAPRAPELPHVAPEMDGRKARTKVPRGGRDVDLRRASDEELMRQYYAKGPTWERAFAIIQERYLGRLAGRASAKLGEDESQGNYVALLTLLKVADTIGKDSQWNEGEPFKPWLATIFNNTLRDYVRRRREVVRTGKDLHSPGDDDKVISFGDHVPSPRPASENELGSRGVAQEIRECIDRLPQSQRAIARMKLFKDLNGKQIAARLKTSEGTVSKRWQSAVSALVQCLREKGIAPPPTRGRSVPAGHEEGSHE